MTKPGVQVIKDYITTFLSLASIFLAIWLIFYFPQLLATALYSPHSIATVLQDSYYNVFPLKLVLFYLALMLIAFSIPLPFRWRKLRKEQREFNLLLEQPDVISDEHIVEAESPLILPITATQPFTRQEIFTFSIFCLGVPLFLRVTLWARHDPSIASYANYATTDTISDILTLVLCAWLCWLALSSRKHYIADSQGLEAYVRGRPRHIYIRWSDVIAIMYAPLDFSQNSMRRAEQYGIITLKRTITLDVPMQHITEPSNEAEQRLLAYQNALRTIAVVASQETGIPIRVAKKLAEQHAKFDSVTSIPLKQRLTQTTPEQLKACAWLMAVSAAVMLLLAPVCAYFWATASVTRYHPLSGYIDSYQSSTAQLTLMGDPRTYTLSIDTSGDNAFHPALPATIPIGTPVTIWLNGSYSYPDAMQIGTKSTAIKYVDDFYINPVGHYYENRLGFGILTILCLLLGVSCGVWARGLWRRSRAMSTPEKPDLTPVLV